MLLAYSIDRARGLWEVLGDLAYIWGKCVPSKIMRGNVGHVSFLDWDSGLV